MTTRALAGGVWLCPAPKIEGPCLIPLPCRAHEIADVGEGILVYGNAYGRIHRTRDPFEVETRPPARRPARRDRRRFVPLALYALTCVLVVSSLGDDRFTGKTLLTQAAVALSTFVLLVRLNRRHPSQNRSHTS